MEILISIIIPTHNRSILLRRAIESVLKQSYKDFEILVVSDGSTDDTTEVMRGYTDRRIKYIHYPNAMGANHARNIGVAESQGAYIAFLDDDDEWYPSKLEKQLSVFNRDEKIGLVYSGIDIIQQDSGLHYLSRAKEQGDLSKKILFRNYITTTSSVMMKRSLFDSVGGFDEKLPAKQDYDLWIRCLQLTEVGCVKEPLINYYVSNNSSQISSYTDKYILASEMIDKKYDNLFTSLSKKEQKIRDGIKFSGLAKAALKNKHSKECRKYCLKSLKKKPNLYVVGIYIASFLNYDFLMRILQIFRK